METKQLLAKMVEKRDSEKTQQGNTKDKLLATRAHIEHELHKISHGEIRDGLTNSIHNVRELIESVTRMQDELNRVWRRAEQLNEELSRLKQITENSA